MENYLLGFCFSNSELREIPDNQEVFAHSSTDQSIIVELLEYEGLVEDGAAARYRTYTPKSEVMLQSEWHCVAGVPIGVAGVSAGTAGYNLESNRRYYFEDLAGSNEAAAHGASQVEGVQVIPKGVLAMSECSSAWLLCGSQQVSKFNEEVSGLHASRRAGGVSGCGWGQWDVHPLYAIPGFEEHTRGHN